MCGNATPAKKPDRSFSFLDGRECSGSLVSKPAQATDPFECHIPADDRLAVIPTKAGYPVIIFSQSLSSLNEFTINGSRRRRDFRGQTKRAVVGKEPPRVVRITENYSEIARRNNSGQIGRLRWLARKLKAGPRRPLSRS
jgi:hypothetical protein